MRTLLRNSIRAFFMGPIRIQWNLKLLHALAASIVTSIIIVIRRPEWKQICFFFAEIDISNRFALPPYSVIH